MRSFQGVLPIFLSILFFVSIVGTGYIKVGQLEGTYYYIPSMIYILLYVFWIFLESKVATKEIGQKNTQADLGSLEIYALSRALVVLSGLIIPIQHSGGFLWPTLGGVIFLTAVLFRLYSIRHLGQFYSHRVRIRSGHKIIQDGPYAIVRHPAYTGMILAHLGFTIFFFNYVTLTLWAFFHVPAVAYRILIEERSLMELEGYAQYAKNKKRLIPFVW